MEAILKLVTEIHKDVREVDRKLTEHIADETTSAANLIEEFKKNAFVDGDAARHKQMQITALEKAEASSKFYHDIAASVAKWGLIGLFGFIVFAVWRAVLEGPK